MKTMTVRGLDQVTVEKLKKTAKKEKKSVNQLVVEIIKKRFGIEKEKKYTKIHHDLDHLFGCWSHEEFEMIQKKIALEKQIDAELWK